MDGKNPSPFSRLNTTKKLQRQLVSHADLYSFVRKEKVQVNQNKQPDPLLTLSYDADDFASLHAQAARLRTPKESAAMPQ
jgi:hypothetical protein